MVGGDWAAILPPLHTTCACTGGCMADWEELKLEVVEKEQGECAIVNPDKPDHELGHIDLIMWAVSHPLGRIIIDKHLEDGEGLKYLLNTPSVFEEPDTYQDKFGVTRCCHCGYAAINCACHTKGED